MAFTVPLPIARAAPPCARAAVCAAAPPRMSLVSEVVFKAFEVGAATAATRAFAASGAGAAAAAPVAAPAGEQPAPARRSVLRGRWKRDDEPVEAEVGRPAGKGDVSAAASALMAGLLGSDGGAARVGEIGGVVGDTVGVVARAAREDKWTRLAVCILVDLVGSGSLAIPLLGDLLDLVTAAVSALLLQAIFADPRVTGAVLLEELLPGTDVVPSATLSWCAQEAGWLRENGLRVDPAVRESARELVEKGVAGVQRVAAEAAKDYEASKPKAQKAKRGRGRPRK